MSRNRIRPNATTVRLTRPFSCWTLGSWPLWLFSGAAALIGIGVSADKTHASAFPIGVGWPAKSTLEVYVENIDPEAANSRQQFVADGIMRWQNELARGYTINVHLGDPPNPAPENLIRFKWAAPGTLLKTKKLSEMGGLTLIIPDNPQKPKKIVKAEGILSNKIPAGATLKNTAMHEFTHALGLADDPRGRVTNTAVQVGGVMAFNDRDQNEIATLYGRKAVPPKLGLLDIPRGRVKLVSAIGGQYDYLATFEGDETEIVDVVTFFVNPALVTQITAPFGWTYLDPADVASQGAEAPYFLDYMDDGFPDPAPWEALNYLTFRSTDQQYDLSLANPELAFSIFSSQASTGLINVFAGNEHQQVLGPVPEPASAWLLLLGVGFAWPMRRKIY